jgi:L(+)-tartrate dehydratase beta subunit
MDRFAPGLIEQYGVRAIVKQACCRKEHRLDGQHGAAYFAIVGGAAALETMQIERSSRCGGRI